MSGKATREDIVEAADGLFYRHGFDHTSFADIAETVRISRGNFYYHFKTKDQILDAVIERRLTKTRAMLDQWEIAGDTPAARLRAAGSCPCGTSPAPGPHASRSVPGRSAAPPPPGGHRWRRRKGHPCPPPGHRETRNGIRPHAAPG